MSGLVEHAPPGGSRRVTRTALLRGAAGAALGLALPGRLHASVVRRELLGEVSIDNGARPYAGDGPLLATVNVNGSRGRTEAVVRFVLGRPATVQLDVVDENANVTDLRGVKHP